MTRDWTPGIHRVLDTPDRAATLLGEAGWTTAISAPATTTTEFYDALAAALHLPDYFGRNLDALWDVLTDLDGPTALILADWTAYATARPARWSKIVDLLIERTELDPPFAVFLVD